MNQLSVERRAAVVRCLIEGNSMRAAGRLTGTSLNTVTKLLVDMGEMCALYHQHVIRGIRARLIQCDEIWAFVGAKQKHVQNGAKGEGDTWTWTAMDADSKLMVSWMVGRRNARTAVTFLRDLRSRLANRVQLTTDGHHVYLGAVESAFGWNRVDYAMLVKLYGRAEETNRAYSPPVCIGAIKQWVMGNPDEDHVSTSFVERQNLTMRMGMRRFTRLTNGFSKKVENHRHSVAVHFMHYNFCRPHTTLTKAHPQHYPTTPAMAAGLTDHVWTVEELCGLLDPARLLQ
ncbi:MAG TPA: IS1 family transposase [Gemmatimonadales bacterium]|nr:IS1 family transposase [Gemmatimonadales bacterium]